MRRRRESALAFREYDTERSGESACSKKNICALHMNNKGWKHTKAGGASSNGGGGSSPIVQGCVYPQIIHWNK